MAKMHGVRERARIGGVKMLLLYATLPQFRCHKVSQEMSTYPSKLHQILTLLSTDPITTTISRPSTLPRCRGTRHTELHLRPEQQHVGAGANWSRGLTIQRHLPVGRQSYAPVEGS